MRNFLLLLLLLPIFAQAQIPRDSTTKIVTPVTHPLTFGSLNMSGANASNGWIGFQDVLTRKWFTILTGQQLYNSLNAAPDAFNNYLMVRNVNGQAAPVTGLNYQASPNLLDITTKIQTSADFRALSTIHFPNLGFGTQIAKVAVDVDGKLIKDTVTYAPNADVLHTDASNETKTGGSITISGASNTGLGPGTISLTDGNDLATLSKNQFDIWNENTDTEIILDNTSSDPQIHLVASDGSDTFINPYNIQREVNGVITTFSYPSSTGTLALDGNVLHTTGNETKTGNLILNGDFNATEVDAVLVKAPTVSVVGTGTQAIVLTPDTLNISGGGDFFKMGKTSWHYKNGSTGVDNHYALPDSSGKLSTLTQTVRNGAVYSSPSEDAVYHAINSTSTLYQPLENQRLSTTDAPTFSDIETTGSVHLNNGIIANNAAYLSVIGHAGVDFYTNDGPSRPLILDGNNATVTGALTAGGDITAPNFHGLADNATLWGGRDADLTTLGTNLVFLYGTDNTSGLHGRAWSASMVRTFLGSVFSTNLTAPNFYTTSATPTVVLGSSAVVGTGATISFSTGSTNTSGTIILHTGTTLTAGGHAFTVTNSGGFAFPNSCTPVLQINVVAGTSNNLPAIDVQTATTWGVALNDVGATQLLPNTTYAWNYINIGQ